MLEIKSRLCEFWLDTVGSANKDNVTTELPCTEKTHVTFTRRY